MFFSISPDRSDIKLTGYGTLSVSITYLFINFIHILHTGKQVSMNGLHSSQNHRSIFHAKTNTEKWQN